MESLLPMLLALPLCAQPVRYQHGDDARWADPSFDDSAWSEEVNGNIPAPPFQSGGYLWIRQRMPVDPATAGPLAIRISKLISSQALPSETQVNGTRVASLAAFPPDSIVLNRPMTLVFDLCRRDSEAVLVSSGRARLRDSGLR